MTKAHAEHDPIEMFNSDALDLLNARQRGKQAHQQKNIREAGDEVEIKARQILSKRYSGSAYATHGHIIDGKWNVSRQMDFILADPRLFPIWNIFQSGAENILYDSVYAIGDIKSSYYNVGNQDCISKFSESIALVKNQLRREPSSTADRFGMTFSGAIELTTTNTDPYRNPLFSFMLIVDSTELNLEALRKTYSSTPLANLPNIVCFLDRGCLVNAPNFTDTGTPPNRNLLGLNIVPEFDVLTFKNTTSKSGAAISCNWVLLEPKDTLRSPGINLMVLYVFILDSIRRTILKPANISEQLLQSASWKSGDIIA